MILSRNTHEFAFGLFLGIAVTFAAAMSKSKRKKSVKATQQEKRGRISLDEAPPSESDPSQIPPSEDTNLCEGDNSEYEDQDEATVEEDEEASRKLAARPPTPVPAPAAKSPPREPNEEDEEESEENEGSSEEDESSSEEDEEKSEYLVPQSVKQPAKKASIARNAPRVAKPAASLKATPTAAPARAAASVASAVSPAQMAAPATTPAVTQAAAPVVTMAAPTANVQHPPAHHDAVSQSLTSNTKFEQLTEQFAREMDVTNIKLHGTKERIEFLDRVKTVVQLKALLNDLELLQVGGRLYNIFQEFSKIDLDLVIQAARSKHLDAHGKHLKTTANAEVMASRLFASTLQKILPKEAHGLIMRHFNHVDSVTKTIAMHDGHCYFIALCRYFFPTTTELKEYFRGNFSKAKVTDFKNLKDYANHQYQCLDFLSSEFDEDEGRTILEQLQKSYPGPKLVKAVEDYRDNQLKAENPTTCPSARKVLHWATSQEDIYVQGNVMKAYDKDDKGESATEVQALLAHSQPYGNSQPSGGRSYTLQEALKMGQHKFFDIHGYNRVRRSILEQPSFQIGGVTAHWCATCKMYNITHSTESHKPNQNHSGSHNRKNQKSQNPKKHNNSNNNNSTAGLKLSKTRHAKLRKEIKANLSAFGVDDISGLPPVLRSIVDPSSERHHSSQRSGAGSH
jgi:hypothetical protein